MSVAALAVRDVTHRYSESSPAVLSGVTLRIEAGETVALMGPSGSGKTTLLTILGLLITPSEGTVELDGAGVPRGGPSLARIRAERFGWVFQTANALPRRTALDNAALGLLVRGETRAGAREKAAAALDAVGVAGLAQKEARQLSGGELQRVCIARALAARPSFILADEPTGQLDHATTLDVTAALLRNRPEGTAVILATHDAEVARQCDRLIRVIDGHVEEAAP
jgi:ABC-type lipoprotein export system ATPase subunit